jgi:hypothetical protein
MNNFSAEYLEKLSQDYEFVAKSLGFFKENYNFYARVNGLDNINNAIGKMEAEKLELAVKIDFLTNLLNS